MAVQVPAQFQPLVNQAARGTGLPAAVVAAQANEESGFNPNATSPTGAQGWLQFEPSTWKAQGVPGSPYNPQAATQGYIKLMGSLLRQFGGNVRNALAAYNAGPGNLAAGYGYADTILRNAGAGATTIGGGAAGVPSTGGSGGATSTSITFPVTTQTFNQAGYDQARAKFLAGLDVQATGGSNNPFNQAAGTSSGFASALSGSNPLFSKGLLTTSAPNAQSFVGSKTTEETITATGALQKLAGTSLVNTHAGAQGDVNPIPGAVIGRTDMGVDANLKPGSPILAPNTAKVVATMPDWYQGQPYIAVQLTAGPNAGKVMYVAEQINGVPKVGTVIQRGQPITRYAGSGTGIEIGWANPKNPTQTLAQGTSGYSEGQQTSAGQQFRSYLGSVGA